MSLMLGKNTVEDPFEKQYACFEKRENGYGLYIYLFDTYPDDEAVYTKAVLFEDMLKCLQENPVSAYFFGAPVSYYKTNKDFRKAINEMGLKKYFTHKVSWLKKLKFERAQEKLLQN